MPAVREGRLPFYGATGTLLLTVSVFYAVSITGDPRWRINATAPGDHEHAALLDRSRNITELLSDVVSFMAQEPLCMWCGLVGACCVVMACGVGVRRAAFGRLRAAEAQGARDKLWNYIFYKFIFVFGVVNVQLMEEVVVWCGWFAALGALHLLTHLSKDRLEYLCVGGGTRARWAVARLAVLQGAVLTLALVLLWLALAWGRAASLHTAAFMAAECTVVALAALQVAVRCALHACEARHDSRGHLAYYTQLGFETASLCVELVHHVHMLVWSNMFLSMASLVLLMQLRYLFHELQARLRRHRVYLWVLRHMDRNYPMASATELAAHRDHCAICWERMETARKLPCHHLFHNSCLSSWLQQDASCPTCRRELPAWGAPSAQRTPSDVVPLPLPPRPRHAPDHLFHFDGSRYLSWLPSFSVEVTRVRAGELDALARQAHQLFPHYELRTLAADLRRTRSLHATVDNVLEGRLPPPVAAREPEEEEEVVAPLASRASPRRTLSTDEGGDDTSGVRFAKERVEREHALRRRKEQMVATARARYLQRRAPATATQILS